MNLYCDLFWTFSKIGVCTFGGGCHAPHPPARGGGEEGLGHRGGAHRLLCHRPVHPGIIAVNTATFVGHKYRGVSGGVVATLGLVFPSLIIITLIAAFLSSFADSPGTARPGRHQRLCGGSDRRQRAEAGKTTLKTPPPCVSSWRCWPWQRRAACCPWTPPPHRRGAGLSLLPAILVVLAGAAGWLLSLLRPKKEGGEER